METPVQKCARLVATLEDLVAQEAANLKLRDFGTVVALQRRAAPLVDYLVVHGPAVVDDRLRARIAAVIARRNEAGEWLSAEIERTREQLNELEMSQRRVAKVAPVYGGTRPRRSSLCAIG